MIEPGLRAKLATDCPTAGGRVYPVTMPQDVVYPALSYQLISAERFDSADGADGLVTARYQVNAAAKSYEEMKTLLDEVRQSFHGWGGTMNGHNVARIAQDGGADGWDLEADATGVYFGPTDYMIQYTD